MTRSLLVLSSPAKRAQAIEAIRQLPHRARVALLGPKRTASQSNKMWALLEEVAEQATHCGRKYRAGIWKALFMEELGRETLFIPDLHYEGVVPIEYSTSDLPEEEMGLLIELIYAWGAQNGVRFKEDEERAD